MPKERLDHKVQQDQRERQETRVLKEMLDLKARQDQRVQQETPELKET